MGISYTNHIGRSSRDTHFGKNNTIASLADLAAAEKHNNHNYTQDDINHMQSNIDLSLKHLNRHYKMVDGVLVEHRGYLDLVDNVRKIYDEQFTDAILAYNLHKVATGHPDRQIGSYIDKISEDKQVEVAVEGLIQFGSLEDWQGNTLEERRKAGPLLLQCLIYTLDELKGENKDFILAGASLHLNEGTPHLHYVGVPVQETPNAKNGLKKRVKKAAIFTKDSLGTGLQDHVRKKIAPFVKEALGWEFEEKRSGRNEDLTKNRYVNDMLQKQIQEANKNLQKVNQKLQKSEQKLTDIELTLQSATSELEHNLRILSQEVVKTVASDPGGAYSDVLFFIDSCNDERFEELAKESHMLKKSILGQYASTALSDTNLEQRINNIVAGKTRPREMTWEERLALWAKYSQMSGDFWIWRRELLNRHDNLLHKQYEKRYFAKCRYYAAMEMLHESQDLISMLIATAWALYEIKKEQEINTQIAEIREQKSIVAKNTTSFKTFSAAYREELKSGKMPGENLLIAMTNAIETLDQECERFLAKDSQHKQRQHLDSSRERHCFWL